MDWNWRESKLVQGNIWVQYLVLTSAFSMLMLAVLQLSGFRQGFGLTALGSFLRFVAGVVLTVEVLFQGSRKGVFDRKFSMFDIFALNMGAITIFLGFYSMYASMVAGASVMVKALYMAFYDFFVFSLLLSSSLRK